MTDDVGSRGGHVVIIIQNLPLRLDRRVRNECRALLDAGYRVSVICPKEDGDEPDRHEIDSAVVYSYAAPEGASGLLSYVREFLVCWLQAARLSMRVNRESRFDVLQACNPPDTYWLLGAIWKLRSEERRVGKESVSMQVRTVNEEEEAKRME